MNTNFDELKLTDYALGEVDETERQAVAAHLATDVAARAHVEEIRATAQLVSGELAKESQAVGVGLTAVQYANIERRLDGGEAPLRLTSPRATRRNWGLWGSVAASVLIVGTVMASVLPMVFRGGNGKAGATSDPNGGTENDRSLADGGTIRFLPGDADPDASASADPATRPIPNRHPADATDASADVLPGTFPWGGDQAGHATPPAPAGAYGAHAGIGFRRSIEYPRSTFAPRAGAASHAEVRRLIEAGRRPTPDAVRIDELLNAFAYADARPAGDRALAVTMEVAGCPWNAEHRLVRIALTARGDGADGAGPTTQSLGTGASGGLPIVARDVRVQVEFNPTVAGAYRLIGHRGRPLPAEALEEDEDATTGRAASLVAGQTATALYEVVPAGKEAGLKTTPPTDALKYQRPATVPSGGDEMLTVKVRYKLPGGIASRIDEASLRDGGTTFAAASQDFRFASAVAAFGMTLNESEHRGSATLDLAAAVAGASTGSDADGRRAGFVELVNQARGLR